MINTTILRQEEEGSKTFDHKSIFNLTGNVLNHKTRGKIYPEIVLKTRFSNTIDPSYSSTNELVRNEVFFLTHQREKQDLILPSKPSPDDWIILLYNQTSVIEKVSFDLLSQIVIHGNGERIMQMDEPLFCDIAFSSLRLLYVDKSLGWVIT